MTGRRRFSISSTDNVRVELQKRDGPSDEQNRQGELGRLLELLRHFTCLAPPRAASIGINEITKEKKWPCIEWSNELSVNMPLIDKQHHELFIRAINLLAMAVRH